MDRLKMRQKQMDKYRLEERESSVTKKNERRKKTD